MRILKTAVLALGLATALFAQLPKAGTIQISADGSIGGAFGDLVSEENEFGNKIPITVGVGTNPTELSTVDYKHFAWSGEANFDVFLGKRFALGVNGGYKSIMQKIVAQESEIEKKIGSVTGVSTLRLGATVAIPVEDNMYFSLKFLGGYGFGKVHRAPAIALSTTKDPAFEAYIDAINKAVDIAGPSAGFEVKINVFESYGLMGSAGVRYDFSMFTAESIAPISATDPSYSSDETSYNHSISAVISIGFGFKMQERFNFYN